MKQTLSIIACLLLTLPLRWALADVYTGEVAVSGQTDTERHEMIPDALIQVLQKLSGRRELPLDPALDEILADAERMLLAFHYRNVEKHLSDGTNALSLRLVGRFQPDEVNRAADKLGLPRWQPERRPLATWVIVDDGFERRLMPLEFAYVWDAMEDVAAARGLELAWPQISTDDLPARDLQLLWGGFTEIAEAISGPGSDILIAAAQREGPTWQIRWHLSGSGSDSTWRTQYGDLVTALTAGIHTAVDTVATANQIAVADLGATQHDIFVGGIRDAHAYARCLEYISQLSLVSGFNVVSTMPGRIRFRLELTATPDYLDSALRRDGVLEQGSSANEYVLPPLPVHVEEE